MGFCVDLWLPTIQKSSIQGRMRICMLLPNWPIFVCSGWFRHLSATSRGPHTAGWKERKRLRQRDKGSSKAPASHRASGRNACGRNSDHRSQWVRWRQRGFDTPRVAFATEVVVVCHWKVLGSRKKGLKQSGYWWKQSALMALLHILIAGTAPEDEMQRSWSPQRRATVNENKPYANGTLGDFAPL